MFKHAKRKINKQSGAAMLTAVIFFLFIALAIVIGLVSPSVRQFKISNDLVKSRQSLFLSESAVEDSYYRLKTAQTLNEANNTITLGSYSATATVTDSGYNEKTISSLGDVDSRERKNELVLTPGTGASFSYGVQVGVGGMQIDNGAVVFGSVYSNGTINGGNNSTITGTAYSAGSSGLIDNVDIGTSGVGNAYAHTINNATVQGTKYCQSTNKSPGCDTSLADPEAVDMPITDQQILDWKAEGDAGDQYSSFSVDDASQSLGPAHITGNLFVGNHASLTITGTVWVEGNVTIENGANVSLSPSYGSSEGVIVTDGLVNINNNATFSGSGTTGSYLMVLSTSTSSSAITLENNGGAVILYAANGTVNLANNASATSLNGKYIHLHQNSEVIYDSGLVNSNFVNGPSGGWSISSWKEVK